MKAFIGSIRRSTGALAFAALAIALAGCTQTKSFVHDEVPPRPAGDVDILLLEPDIELSEISVGGIPFPKADWTERGRANVNAALTQIMDQRDSRLVYYEGPPDAPPEHPYNQILKLHEAVGAEILSHKYSQAQQFALPTKKDRFDWTLGPEVQKFRDSFSSGGRKAMMVVMGALFAVVPPGGRQIGYASLVDLESGDILWFNVLSSEVGDLRDPASAAEATEELLDQLPL